MTVRRMEVRHAVRDRLIDATAAGDRVYVTRKRSVWSSKLPALAVYTTEETEPELVSASEPLIWRRELVVAVDVLVDESDGIPDDQVDLICQQVEQAIFGGERLLGLEWLHDLVHAGVQFRFDGDAKRLKGAARVLIRTPYEFRLDEDPASLAPWVLMATDWDLAPPDGTAEALDQQELEQ